jgi:hypothetical protein
VRNEPHTDDNIIKKVSEELGETDGGRQRRAAGASRHTRREARVPSERQSKRRTF